MDRGAARSRRVEEGRRKTGHIEPQREFRSTDSRTQHAHPPSKGTKGASTSRFKPKVIDNTDTSRFRPKAVRDSAALVWSQGEFPMPPSRDALSSVTRVDLYGSDCTDVSWLRGTQVTWLNLRGCKVNKGWDAVGSLSDLSVLNISETGLTHLPEELGTLRKLKAVVAMGNMWTKLDSSVVEQWHQLNSLIVSHSPKLKSLPNALRTLPHLAKMSFSHCPCVQAGGLPDLTHLPLLRDVKLNNLPLLDKLPGHLSTWGTGTLPVSEHVQSPRQGDGLEVLDLGNCSLSFPTIESLFLRQPWHHLRSLSLHSNPLAVSNPEYASQLRNSSTLPNLQIIDAKRVVERKRKGEVQETRLERRRRLKKEKNQSTGANAKAMSTNSRTWGGQESVEDHQAASTVAQDASLPGLRHFAPTDAAPSNNLEQKRKRKREDREVPKPIAIPIEASQQAQVSRAEPGRSPVETSQKRKRSKHRKNKDEEATTSRHQEGDTRPSLAPDAAPAQSDKVSKPISQRAQPGTKPIAKSVGAKVETIVKSAGGVNLKEVLGQPNADRELGDFGVGGW